mgnify:CR=1 FL=1
MNDKELLELAAKAAGYEKLGLFWNERLKCLWDAEGFSFDPLEDDGDALRLAVKLEIDVSFYKTSKGVGALCEDYSVDEDYGDDPYAATRRAIVRAAAEIGRGM